MLRQLVLSVLINFLNANDLNISYNSFIEEKIKNNQDLFLLKRAIDNKERIKKEYDKLIEDTYSYRDVYAMYNYFKRTKQDKSCKLTYSNNKKHTFAFSCKNKKRNKVFKFNKDYLFVEIKTDDMSPLGLFSIEIINLPIDDMQCQTVCGFGWIKMICVLKPYWQ